MTDTEIMAIVFDTRRAQLRKWIDEHCGGQQVRLIEASGINQGELSALLRDKAFGERRARSLEIAAGMPYLYLDRIILNRDVEQIAAGQKDVADQVAELVRSMSPAGQYVALGRIEEMAEKYPATS